MVTASRARILLVGAFERDNFGDLLFYELTREYFESGEVSAGSVIRSDMTALIGTRVSPYNDLLATRAWDLVWVVGGEIGGVDTSGALAMSLSDSDGAIFDAAGRHGQAAIAQYLSGGSTNSPAYLPELDRFPLNENTPLVLNSVGLGNLDPTGQNAQAATAVIRGASAVTVRDRASFVFAETIRSGVTLSPDMVHAISVRHPELARPGAPRDPYFVFQCSAGLIDEYAPETIATGLAAVSAATGWRPAFFLAGTARHHDRADQYAPINAELKKIAPGLIPVTIESRRPMALASFIARSQLWIGSSLHGRVIAGSFGLPRVALKNTKVEGYAASWDPAFPVNVEFARLADATDAAVSLAARPEAAESSREVAFLADAGTAALVESHR